MEVRNTTDKEEKKTRHDHNNNQLILSLPGELFNQADGGIGQYLTDIKDIVSVSKTCTSLNLFFQANRAREGLQLLLQSVVDGDRVRVKKILDAQPSLLLLNPGINQWIESKKTWQIFRARTPLEMAFIRRQLKMVELILPYFARLENGESIKNDQLAKANATLEQQKARQFGFEPLIKVIAEEIFPNGFPNEFPYNFEGKLSEKTETALSTFRKIMLPDEIITLDDYFDVEALLLAAYEAYNDYFDTLQNWDRRSLFCICVIGFLQSLVTPELAEVFCEGLYNVVESKRSIGDRAASLKLSDSSTSFYRLDRAAHSGLGFSFLVSILAEAVAVRSMWRAHVFQNLCRAKTSDLQSLCNHTFDRSLGV